MTLTAQSLALVSGSPLAGLWCRGVASALMWRSRRRSAVNRYRLRKSAEVLLRGRGPSSSTRAFLGGHSASCLSCSLAAGATVCLSAGRPGDVHPTSPTVPALASSLPVHSSLCQNLDLSPFVASHLCFLLSVSFFNLSFRDRTSKPAAGQTNFAQFHTIRCENFTNCSISPQLFCNPRGKQWI